MKLHRSPTTSISHVARSARLLAILVISIVVGSLGLFGASGTSIASAQSFQNEIRGVVVNGTEGGVIPDGFTVLLLSVDQAANQIIEQESTTVGADGTFSFGNLISGPGVSFRVVADAGDYTPSIDLTNVDDWTDVRLTIYDQTTSLEDVSVSTYVMMIPTIDSRSRQAGILAVVNVNNSGDRVWVPDLTDPALTGFDLLRFSLPVGYTDLSVESELPTGNILEINSGFAMTNPVPPGEAAILMSYIVPYQGDGFEFTLGLPYGADQVRVLMPDGGGAISGDGFGPTESVVVAETVFNSIESDAYAVGDEVVISFTGLPQPTPLQRVSDFFQGRAYAIVIVWVVGIALLGILGFALYSSRRAGRTSEDTDEHASRAGVIAEIAALDEEFEAGKLDEAVYESRRDELKQLALDYEGPGTADYSN